MCNPSNIAYFTLDIKGDLKSFIHSFRDVFFDRYRYIEYYIFWRLEAIFCF